MHPSVEKLISIAKEGSEITERQKEIILRKAAELGDDVEEIEFILEGIMHPVKKEREHQVQTLKHAEEVAVSGQNSIASNPKNTRIRKQIFRNKTNARLFGVCSGFADYFGVDPKTIRAFFVLLMIVQFNILVWEGYGMVSLIVLPLLYIVAGFVLPELND